MKNQVQLISVVTILFFASSQTCAQHVMGRVLEKTDNKTEIPIAGASVYFPGTAIGTSTGEDGWFHLDKPDASFKTLVVSFIGYLNDTIPAEGHNIKVVLEKSILLKEVEVKGARPESFISKMEPVKTEVLTTEELKKNACCNLSESFESNPTVDVSFSDAATGSRQIQMLGLSGTYVQSLVDILPTLRGLNSTFGFNFIPGTWVQDIYVSKGTGSVVNGYESITGQIDVELKKPEKTDKFLLNIYGNSEGRAETNLHYSLKLDEKWSTLLLAHGSTLQNKMDHNNDLFMDQPLFKQYQVMNRWKFESGKRVESMFGVRFLEDDRTGGDLRYDEKFDKLTTHYYGLGVNTRRLEAFLKTGYGFYNRDYKSIGLQVSFVNHAQQSYFGLRQYDGRQQSFYANLIYNSIISTTQHKFRAGFSFLADHYDEQFMTYDLVRREAVPGTFFEYAYDDLQHWTMVAGLRADHNSEFDFFYSPRLHVRYKFSDHTVVRASAGSGYHVANVFAENASLMAGSRAWIITEPLRPEHGWNYGINLTHNFLFHNREGHFTLDAYRTDFTNQVIVDVYRSPFDAVISNLYGKSFSNSIQAEAGWEVFFNFKMKVAWKVYDARSTYNGVLRRKPLNPSQRGLLNMAYETFNGKWKFDFTTQWVGSQQLPRYDLSHFEAHSDQLKSASTAPSFFRLLGQVTYLNNRWEIYSGCENINDFIQHDPVVGFENPFGRTFDTSVVWGPVSGRMFYAGLRYTVK